jgi:hypothetical protein
VPEEVVEGVAAEAEVVLPLVVEEEVAETAEEFYIPLG